VLGVVSYVAFGRAVAPSAGYVDITAVPAERAARTGGRSYTWSCGRTEIGHRNTANVVVSSGWTGQVHHTHDYVGDRMVGPDTDLNRLAEGPTTCGNGDASTYY
jgi:hypothetical protein